MIEIWLIVGALGWGLFWTVQYIVQELLEDEPLPPVTQPQPEPCCVDLGTRRALTTGRHRSLGGPL